MNENLLLSNVTILALQDTGIPVPSVGTGPQLFANPTASKVPAGACPEEAPAGQNHLKGELNSRNYPGGNPDSGGSSDSDGEGRRKKSQPSRKKRDSRRRKGGKGAYPPSEGPSTSYSSSASYSPSDSESDSESESLTAPVPTFGPKQKRVSVWKPTKHSFRGVCNYRAYRFADTRHTEDDKFYASTRKRVQYLLVLMGDYKFSRANPFRFKRFLARCKENFDNAQMTEAMVLMASPICYGRPRKKRMSPRVF